MTDPFYKTPAWRRLRAAVIKRSRGRCEVPGCTDRGVVVNHVVSRRRGGPDTMSNLRHLCRAHDNAIKEDASGKRRSDGKLVVRGCNADGTPLDPASDWFRDGR
jgi:5-methylcytosine-specific restriction endonuclease McrA